MGFNFNEGGDVIDPVKNEVIMKGAITRDLAEGLKRNNVKVEDNYYKWDKAMMVKKIGMVMGIDPQPTDPDPTYVLTPDNVIKLLAIQMKFRFANSVSV